MRSTYFLAVSCGLVLASAACGGAKNSPATDAPSAATADGGASASPSGDAGSTATTLTSSSPGAGADAGVAAAPEAHPFAKDAAAAESMIDDAIETRHSAVEKCAAEQRKRSGDPHQKVSVLIGIDQEGTVLGIKSPKGDKNDEKFIVCVRAALKDAPFPRSHSGVITIKKTYEETLQGQL